MSNIDRYLEFMTEASDAGADIIVFPEYGVSGVSVSEEKDRDLAREFMVIGEVGRNYCADDGDIVNPNDEVMRMVGCGAVANNMYVVINIGEMVNCSVAQVIVKCLNCLNTNLDCKVLLLR